MALAVERGCRQHCSNLVRERSVGPCGLGSSALEKSERYPGKSSLIVEARTSHLPFAKDMSYAINAACGGRTSVAHRFDPRQAKGRPASVRGVFFRSNS